MSVTESYYVYNITFLFKKGCLQHYYVTAFSEKVAEIKEVLKINEAAIVYAVKYSSSSLKISETHIRFFKSLLLKAN